MKTTDIQNVIELLKLAKFGEEIGEEKDGQKSDLEAKSFGLPDELTKGYSFKNARDAQYKRKMRSLELRFFESPDG